MSAKRRTRQEAIGYRRSAYTRTPEEFPTVPVVLELRNGRYFCLNRTGALVWNALAEKATKASLLERIKVEFPDAPEDTLESDLEDLLRVLLQSLLIVKEDCS